MFLAIILLVLCCLPFQAAAPPDSAVFGAFRHADARLAHFATLQRTAVTDELDLVIVIGSPAARPIERTSWVWWSEERTVGLFLQEKSPPQRAYALGMKSGFEDCAARIERATVTDSVISCQGEKSQRYPNQKWVYDAHAKKLLRQFSYRPFAMVRCFRNAAGAVFVGTNTENLIAVEYRTDVQPAFRILDEFAARRWIARVKVDVGTQRLDEGRYVSVDDDEPPPPKALSSFPQSTYDEFAAARPLAVKSGLRRESTRMNETVGPWKREPGRIWFGKTFYDGEGYTGVGAFGYFDTSKRRLHLLKPPEIADWSVSAIELAPDAVGLALVHNGEYGGSPGGLLRYDRQSGTVRRIALPDICARLLRVDEKILAATDFGIAIVEGDQAKRFFVDQTSSGRLRVVPATR